MTRMIRLDPAHVPLIRDPGSVQFGAEPVAVVDDVQAWQERLVRELTRGLPESGLDVWADLHRVHARLVREFLDRIRPALRVTDADADPQPPLRRIVVERQRGSALTPLAHTLASALAATGARTAVRASAADPRTSHAADAEHDAVVLVASHALDTRLAAAHACADRAHLPVVATGTEVVVGPLVLPGRTACCACLDLHRRDADVLWPRLALQLLAAPAVEPPAHAIHAAAAAAVRLMTTPWHPAGTQLRLATRAPSETARVIPAHEMCGCRAPRESATAPSLSARRVVPTTTTPRSVPA